MGTYLGDIHLADIDFTQDINFTHSWDSFNIQNREDYINNFSLYLDETIYEINTAIFNRLKLDFLADPFSTSPTATNPLLYQWSAIEDSTQHLFMLEENLIYTHNEIMQNLETGLTTDGIIVKP